MDAPIAPDRLLDFATAAYVRAGMTEPDARLAADTLVQADLWGHQSHGVLRLPWYVARLRAGVCDPVAQTLPVTLPIAILLGKIDRGRLRKAASAMRCVRCGHELGAAALDAAAAAAREARQQQRPFNGFRRLAPAPDARCVGCRLFYRWNAHLRTLEVAPDMSLP